jgi:NADPH2:quinone reductase
VLPYGGGADVVALGPESVFPLPDAMSFEQGAALPMNYLTAQFALATRGQLKEGETVLVHGAAGGVGTATIQVAKAMEARVIASVSTDAKAEIARAAGADEVVVGEDFRSQLDGPVDMVVDPVGGTERFKESLRSLATEGRVVVVGFTAGEIPELRVNRLLLRNVDVIGCSFNVLATSPNGMCDTMARLTELVETGAVKPLIGSTYPLEQGSAALLELAERRATGKVVLTP